MSQIKRMKKFSVTITLIVIMLLGYSGYATAHIIDSIGVEKIDGRWFLIHRVDQNESVYAIAKRYNVSASDILERNPDAKDRLSIGQKLEIPLRNYSPNGKALAINHEVVPGETLYSISRQYDIDVADLKTWNDLESNEISVGQVLVIQKGTGEYEESSLNEVDQSDR